MAYQRRGGCPEYVECSGCGQMRRTNGRVIASHSGFELGPQCPRSSLPPTAEELEATVNVQRAKRVMHWAVMLHDEDPAHVQRWIGLLDRTELEAMLITALAAIPDDKSVGQAFAWVKELA